LKPFDADGMFWPVAADGDGALRQIAAKGAGITLLSAALGLGIQVVATMALARLLTPRDFGLVTMVTTFSLLLVNFGLNGLTEAIIQREEFSHPLASNLFWINIGAGLLLTIGFAAAGSLLARFYHDPRVARVAVGMSVTIFLTSTSVVHLALLKRAMRFSSVSAVETLGRGASVSVSIFLALAGWGYWALVAAAVVQPMIASIGAWFLCRWVPGLPRRVAGTGATLQFATHVYGWFSVNYFARNMDNVLVGWRFSAHALGVYKKAYDLFALSVGQFVAPLSDVAVSALSRLRRDPVQYRQWLISTLGVVAFLGMGLGAGLTLTGRDLIRLLLGTGWEEAGRIFTYFGPGIGIMILYCTHSWIHLSIGRADRWFRWGIVQFAVTGLLFILGLRWGPAGIAVAWSLSFWILTIPALWYAGRPIGLEVAPMFAVVWKYVLASLLAGCATAATVPKIYFLAAATGVVGAATRAVMISLLFGGLYLALVMLLHGSYAPLTQIARLAREMIPLDRFSKPRQPTPPLLL
jgi:O-antigen/teichoic acid export membrane protein